MKLNGLSNTKILASLKACSILDSELVEKDYLRSYRYHPNWSEGVQLVTYENGGGDNLFIIFKGDSILIKGFDHESDVSPHAQDEYGIWPGMYDGAPEELVSQLTDENFDKEDVTFCIWRESENGDWKQGPVVFNNDEDDGSGWLLSAIHTTPSDYIEWGKDYFEESFNRISHDRIHQVFKENE